MHELTVDASRSLGPNTRFWQAVGEDALYFLTPLPQGQYLLDRLGQTGAVKVMRNHYALSDAVNHGVPCGGDAYKEDADGKPVYDFAKMNAVYAEWLKRGIRPVVELDYMPKLLATRGNRSAPKDWGKWAGLMKAFTANLVEKFGREEVRKWYFEFWNEPDGWDRQQMGDMFRLYDVFVDAVESVDPKIRVGGPAAFTNFCLKAFLAHVVNGTNHVTGKKGTRVDYVSYHTYGLSGGWVDQHPLIVPLVQRLIADVLWCQRAIAEYPELSGVEFHLNEWGMCSNYARTVDDYPGLEYRNTEENALFLAKLTHCLWALQDVYNFPTTMALYWGFAWESYHGTMFSGMRALTTAGEVPKPVLTGFEMMAFQN